MEGAMQAVVDNAHEGRAASATPADAAVMVVPRRRGQLSPEQHLMAAVLEDAINELQLHRDGNAGAWATWRRPLVPSEGVLQTTAWVASRDRWWPYSFENICEALGLDVPTIRRRLGIPAAAQSS